MIRHFAILAALSLVIVTDASAALSKDAAVCQSTLARGLAGFKKAKIKAWAKCLNAVLKGKPCDTAKRDAAITAAISKATAAIATSGKCPDNLLFDAPPNGLGFALNCQLEGGNVEASSRAASVCR